MNILAILTIVFVILKLSHNVDWHWFWVVSPMGLPMLIYSLVLAVSYVITKLEEKL